MTDLLRPAFALVGVFTLLLGIVAPLAMTGIAGVAFPHQANGSLITRDGLVIGSALIGQNFSAPRYFHPRPSATTEADPANPGSTRASPYNGAASAASQLGPTSMTLLDSVRERLAVAGAGQVPADAVTTSASGLDPHISLENALRQVERVAGARGIDGGRVMHLVMAQVKRPRFGLLGVAHISVLELNLALDGPP